MTKFNRRHVRGGRGFTLVEILIVVIILGILAAIVVPQFAGASTEARRTSAIENWRTITEQFRLYQARTGQWPADRTPAEFPPEMAGLVDTDMWAGATSIGGQWDWDHQQFGCTAGVSIRSPDRTAAEMTEIDAAIDDGDLTTGAFRARAGGYIWILEP